MTILEVCGIFVTLFFGIFIFYLIRTLKSIRRTLYFSNKVLRKVEDSIEPLSVETKKLLSNSNQLTESVYEQLESFNPLLQSISQVGQFLQETTSSLDKLSQGKEENQSQSALAELAAIAIRGILICQKFRKRRNKND